MGVYTSITAEEIKTHLEGYDLGELDYFEAITEGIENSNYLISTRRLDHEFLSILTLVEGNNAAKVSEVSAVMKHLAHYGLPMSIVGNWAQCLAAFIPLRPPILLKSKMRSIVLGWNRP
jgi:Ser/Thr protein kinase RdoA (MazF antagonist)